MSSHSLGASSQQLLMLSLLDEKIRENIQIKDDYLTFIKDIYGFNMGLSPTDVFKFYSGIHYVPNKEREHWEEHNHLIIVKGDIISQRIIDPETFDFVMPQHVQILDPKKDMNSHTILNFFTDTDLKEIEKIVSPNVIELSESMPPVRSQSASLPPRKEVIIEKEIDQKELDRRIQRIKESAAAHKKRQEGNTMKDPYVHPNLRQRRKTGSFEVEAEPQVKKITTKNQEPSFYATNLNNKQAAKNPQSGITPGGSSSARLGAAPLTVGQAEQLNSKAIKSTTKGKKGSTVIGSSKAKTLEPPIPYVGNNYDKEQLQRILEHLDDNGDIIHTEGSETDVERASTITGLGTPGATKSKIAELKMRKRGESRDFEARHTDPYRIQGIIESHYNFGGYQRVKRAPQLKRERVIKTDPVTGKSVETYVTTASYGGSEQSGALADFPGHHASVPVVNSLIGVKPKLIKAPKITNKDSPLPKTTSKAVVGKMGLKPGKKYSL